MPLVEIKKIGKKYRLVEKGTSKLARLEKTGTPRDGGGHSSLAKASRQAGYVNQAIRKMGYG